MEEFAEQFIANLEPKESRFDTRLGDDFYISTFPNGVKTWIYVPTVGGHKRRRTLGVYPDMPLEDARQALFQARKLQKVEDELAENGLDQTTVRSSDESRIITPEAQTAVAGLAPGKILDRRTAIAAVAGAVITLSGASIIGTLTGAGPGWLFAAFSSASSSPGAKSSTPAPGTPAVTVRSEPVVVQAPDGAAAEVIAETSELPEPVDDPITEPAESGLTQTEAESYDRVLQELQETLEGTVAREQLTSGISAQQPVDRVEHEVVLEGRSRQLYYYTEVRGMAGKTLKHRWHYEDRLVAEITLKVGEGWRSPLYSSATIGAGMTGPWQVVLTDEEGTELESERFTVRRATAAGAEDSLTMSRRGRN